MTISTVKNFASNSVFAVADRLGMNPVEFKRFLKFAVVGSIGFVVDFGTLWILVELFGMNAIVANVFSFSAAVISNFLFNRYWTYPDSRSKDIWQQLFQFSSVNVVGLGINTLMLALLTSPFDVLFDGFDIAALADRGYIPAKMVATVVVMFWNFFVNRYWTYNDVE